MDLQTCPKTFTAGGAATCESEKPGKRGAWIVVGACLKLKAPILNVIWTRRVRENHHARIFLHYFLQATTVVYMPASLGLQCWGCVILALGMVEFLREFLVEFSLAKKMPVLKGRHFLLPHYRGKIQCS